MITQSVVEAARKQLELAFYGNFWARMFPAWVANNWMYYLPNIRVLAQGAEQGIDGALESFGFYWTRIDTEAHPEVRDFVRACLNSEAWRAVESPEARLRFALPDVVDVETGVNPHEYGARKVGTVWAAYVL